MQYFSTRNASERTSPSLALLTGLAPDGGLYVPEELPALFSAGLYSLERRELFARVISALIDDIPYERILAAVDAGYGGKFDTPAFCPVVKAGMRIYWSFGMGQPAHSRTWRFAYCRTL